MGTNPLVELAGDAADGRPLFRRAEHHDAVGAEIGAEVDQVANVFPATRAQIGIRAGDVIVEANRQAVRSTQDLRLALQKSGTRPALLLINRAGQTIFVAVK